MIDFKVLFPGGYHILDIENDNIDVNIVLSDEDVYFATFFTIKNIQDLMQKEQVGYFWSTDMLIIKDLRYATINEAVRDMIEQNLLKEACTKIGKLNKLWQRYSSFDEIPRMTPVKP